MKFSKKSALLAITLVAFSATASANFSFLGFFGVFSGGIKPDPVKTEESGGIKPDPQGSRSGGIKPDPNKQG